jgi:hypothetical protein
MAKTIRNRNEARQWHETYDPLAPKAGDVAPDFELRDLQGENPTAANGRWRWSLAVSLDRPFSRGRCASKTSMPRTATGYSSW